MMTKRQQLKSLLVCLLGVWICSGLAFSASAIGGETIRNVSADLLEIWNNGAEVTKDVEDNFAIVTADTTNLTEDFYSIFLYDYTKRYLSSCDGLKFSLVNNNESPLKINVTLTENDDQNLSLRDKSFLVLESGAGKELKTQVIKAEYGTVSIPPKFEGTVYIPFTQLSHEDLSKTLLDQIKSFGITAVLEKDKQIQYKIGNIAWIADSIPAMQNEVYSITLVGKDKVVVPNMGSVIEEYKAEVVDLLGNPVDSPVTFSLNEPAVNQLQLTTAGRLEISSTYHGNQIVLQAKTEKSINLGEMIISLERLGTETAKTNIPEPNQVKSIISPWGLQLISGVGYIRLGVGVVLLMLFALFYVWFAESKRNSKVNKEKLLAKLHEDEEEK